MIKGGPKIIKDGLVLCLDAHDAKSYAGEPVTNFLYRLTPRIDSSYSTYVHASNSTWAANHPDALRVYNTDGTEVSSFVNQGANSGNWQVIAHAHWVYDNDLKKPVVKMHRVSGYEGQWRALYSGLNHTLSQLGLTAGDKFTISWLQKADVEGVYARAGMYMQNSSGSRGFHAGQAYSSDVGQLSSELGKWAHKSKTFTVPSGMDETVYKVALYMYGHYTPSHQNTIYISDVQVETGDYATPIVQGVSSSNGGYWGTRSATNGWVDRSGNSNSGTLTNMIGTETDHYRDGQVIMPVANSYLDFDGTNDYVNISFGNGHNPSTDPISYTLWVKNHTSSGSELFMVQGNWGGTNRRAYFGYTSGQWAMGIQGSGWGAGQGGDSITSNVWQHMTIVFDGSTCRWYRNGTEMFTKSYTSYAFNQTLDIGSAGQYDNSYAWDGKISQVLVHNKALTAAEVLQNYNATKGRFS